VPPWAQPPADQEPPCATDFNPSARSVPQAARHARTIRPLGSTPRDIAIPFVLSHQLLDEILQNHRIKSNDLAGIDKLFGGADGYYWYHTLRHMCPRNEVIVWASEEAMRAAVQGQENESAAEDEVKPQVLKDAHVAAMARLLAVPG
jgi:hypothetical protein